MNRADYLKAARDDYHMAKRLEKTMSFARATELYASATAAATIGLLMGNLPLADFIDYEEPK